MEIGAFEGIIVLAVIAGAYHWGRMSMLGDIVKELKQKGVLPDKVPDADSNEAEDEIIKIEQHHGMVYAFGTNDRFLGQGSSYDDLFTAIKQRYPNQSFRLQKTSLDDPEFEKMVTSIFKIFGDKNDKSN